MVALQGGDAHLGGDGHDSCDNGLVVAVDALLGGVADGIFGREVGDAGMSQIGIDARGGVADQGREVVGRDRVARLDHDVCAHAQAALEQAVVDGAQRKEAGDGDLAIRGAVGQNHDVDARVHALLDVGAEGLERLLQGAAVAVEGAVEGLRAQAHLVEGAHGRKFISRKDRRGQAQQAAVAAGVLEEVAAHAQRELRGGLEALAQGVNRRVGDLGEALVEVAVERLGMGGEHRQGLVGAHGGQRRLGGLGHLAHDLIHVVVVVAVTGQPLGERQVAIDGALRGGVRPVHDVGQINHLLVEPVAVGLLGGVGVTNLVVPDDAALVGVHQQHLAGAERPGHQKLRGGDVEGARLGGEDQAVVAREVVAGGAQTVAVERGTHVATVGVDDRGRAVPGLGQKRLVLVEGAACRAELVVVVPGLGQKHADGAGERPAVHDHELQHVVEDRGVGALAVDHGQRLGHAVSQLGGIEVVLAGADPVDVAAQGVDLAVVDEQAVGVGALPAGGRVGGVA